MSTPDVATIRYQFADPNDWNTWTEITTSVEGSVTERGLIFHDAPEYFRFLFERLEKQDIDFANPEDAEGFCDRWERAKEALGLTEKKEAP